MLLQISLQPLRLSRAVYRHPQRQLKLLAAEIGDINSYEFFTIKQPMQRQLQMYKQRSALCKGGFIHTLCSSIASRIIMISRYHNIILLALFYNNIYKFSTNITNSSNIKVRWSVMRIVIQFWLFLLV